MKDIAKEIESVFPVTKRGPVRTGRAVLRFGNFSFFFTKNAKTLDKNFRVW
jgi:hypothetical protein